MFNSPMEYATDSSSYLVVKDAINLSTTLHNIK